MEVPVKAAAALYAERVFGLLKLLEKSQMRDTREGCDYGLTSG